MENSEETQGDLKAVVESVQDYFKKPESYNLESLVTTEVCPVLEKGLENLCLQIENRHKIEETKSRFAIHYTSIFALVSMLQDASTGHKKSSLRLYDSIHSNDPGEGNYLIRDLLQDYKWLEKTDVRHAYIASFIFPNTEREKNAMSDNLVFWREYGQAGEGCSLSLYAPFSKLRRVFYGPSSEDAKRTVAELRSVLGLLDSLKIDDPAIPEEAQKKLAESVCKSLEKIRYLYKSEAYEHENECRFVLLESDIEKDKICFEYQDRNSSPRIRHYYEHEDLQIKNLLHSGSSITFGPSIPVDYRDNLSYYTKELKRRIGDPFAPEIKFSDITYRKS